MSDDRIDLSPLDPGRDPDRQHRVVRSVMQEIAARPRPLHWVNEVAIDLEDHRRPILVAAALLIVLGALAIPSRPAFEQPDETTHVAGLAGSAAVGSGWTDWIEAGHAPTPEELFLTIPAEAR